MTVFAVFAFALLVVSATLIAQPFVVPSPEPESDDDARDVAPALEDERRRLLTAIRELDVDLAAGKLSEADHAELRATYVARAAFAMQQLDEARAARKQGLADTVDVADLRARLEDEIRTRRDALRVALCPRCGSPLPAGPRDHSCREPVVVEEVGRG